MRSAIASDDTLYTALEVDLATSGATLIDSEGNAIAITQADVTCSNGYLHYVDGVLMPPDLMSSLETYNEAGGSYEGVFDTFLMAINLTDLSGDYKGLNGPYTVIFFFLSLAPVALHEQVKVAGWRSLGCLPAVFRMRLSSRLALFSVQRRVSFVLKAPRLGRTPRCRLAESSQSSVQARALWHIPSHDNHTLYGPRSHFRCCFGLLGCSDF